MTRQHFRLFIFYPFTVVTLLVTTIWLATPFVTKYVIKQYMEEQGNHAKIGRLSVDFFPPRVDLKDFVIQREENTVFSLERATFGVALWPLFTKNLHINEGRIQGLTVDVSQQENAWRIAGIDTAQYLAENDPDLSQEEDLANDNTATAWSISLPLFSLTDSQISLSRQPDSTLAVQSDTLHFDDVSVTNVSGQGLIWQGQLAFSGGVNRATVAFNSQFDYAPSNAVADFDLEEAQFSIDSLRHFLPSPLNQGDGEFLASGRATLTQAELEKDLMAFAVRGFTLTMQASELDFALDDDSRVATSDTQVTLNNTELSYRTDNSFSAQGTLRLDSEETRLTQQDNQVQFNQFTLSLPFEVQHRQQNTTLNALRTEVGLWGLSVVAAETKLDNKQLTTYSNLTLHKTDRVSVTGSLSLETYQTKVSQGDNQLSFEQLVFNLPIKLQQDEDVTALEVNNTQLFIGDLLARFEGTSVENNTFHGALKNVTASLSSDGAVQTSFVSQVNSQGFTFTQPAAEGSSDDSPTKASYDKLTFSSSVTLGKDDSGLTLNTPQSQLNLTSLAASSSEFDLENQTLSLLLDDVSVFMGENNSLDASASTHLESHAMRVNQAGKHLRLQDLTLSNKVAVQQDDGGFALQNAQIDLLLGDFNALLVDDKSLSFKRVHASADSLVVDQHTDAPLLIRGSQVDVSTDLFDVMLSKEKRLASWYKAGISDLFFTQQADDFEVSFSQFTMKDLTTSEILSFSDDSQELPPLSQINQVVVEQVSANQAGASIKQITLDELKVNLLLNKTKQLDNFVFADTTTALDTESSQASPPTPEGHLEATQPELKLPYYVILEAFDTTGDSSIYVRDDSIPSTLRRTLNLETLSIRDLNTQDQDQATLITLFARHGRYTTLDTTTKIWPMADKLTLNTSVVLREAELPPYSPYISNVLGYQIDSGQLDLDLNLDINAGILNGQSRILLREFDLGGRQESHSIVRAGAVPLNIAVGILKDNNNNIDLNIPLRGDIDNPSFGWQDFLFLPLRRALYSASTSYLMQTFIPYANVITVAQFASEQLVRIRVQPLLFEPTQANFTESNTVFLTQLTALMKDRQDSQLRACGVTSYQDLGFEQPPTAIEDSVRTFAINLAQQRAENLKDFLVDEGIESSRVFLCAPEVDLSRNSLPRITLNF